MSTNSACSSLPSHTSDWIPPSDCSTTQKTGIIRPVHQGKETHQAKMWTVLPEFWTIQHLRFSKLQWDVDIIEASIHQLHRSLFNQWSNGRLEDIYGNVSANTYANPIQISQRPILTVSVVITTVIEHMWISREKTWSLLNIVAVTAEKGSMDED